MTIHIFAEDTISPNAMGNFVSSTQRRINIRNFIDSSGPHLITFGARCVVADPVADTLTMGVSYETPNGQLKGINLPAPIDLTVISYALGAMWYSPQETVIDKRHPLGDGLGTEPYGTFELNFSNVVPGTSKISYEFIMTVFDGSSTVVNHP